MKLIFIACLVIGIFAFHNRDRQSNAFHYQGTIYEAHYAYTEILGKKEAPDHPATFNIRLLSVSKSNSDHPTFNYVTLGVNVPNSGELLPGTYHFDQSADEDISPFTIRKVNVRMISDDKKEAYSAAGGKVKVSKWEEKYVIEYHLEFSDGKTLNGRYRGKLEHW